MRQHRSVELALLAALFLVAGCKDDDSPTGPTPIAGDGTQARGSERLGWNQSGDASQLRFRAYVDSQPVELPSATCNGAKPEAECSAPLPELSVGSHSIQVVSVTVAGVESPRSEPIAYEKTSARASVSAMPLAVARSEALRLEPLITIADGLEFTADIVATGVHAPAQLAWLPDGRLLVSEADGRVRVVRPGESENREPALEPEMLGSGRVGPMGIASHPDFAQNHLVYLSRLELERGRFNQARLRVLRLREVGDTLGEAATLFDAPVAVTAGQSGVPVDTGAVGQAGPRMAFGPDRLLYLMLPPGMEFVNEPAASTPNASMLRLDGDGRAPSIERLSGVTSSPLAFTWHPTTGAFWVLFPGGDGGTTLRSLDARSRVQTMRAGPARLGIREGTDTAAGTLLHHSAPDDLLVAQALIGVRADGSTGIGRLALPAQADDGLSDRIGDIVAGNGGSLFVATHNILPGAVSSDGSDVVVRLRPVPAKAAR